MPNFNIVFTLKHMCTHTHTIKGNLFYFSNLAVANNAAVKWVHRYLFEMLISKLHAELLQSCASLCDPVDGNLPGSSVHVILQARILSGLPCPLWIYTREWGYWIIWHSIFNFLIKRSIFHNGWIILHSYQQCFLYILANICYPCLFDDSPLNRGEVVSHCHFYLHFPDGK